MLFLICSWIIYAWAAAKLTKALGAICILVGIPTNVISAVYAYKNRDSAGSSRAGQYSSGV